MKSLDQTLTEHFAAHLPEAVRGWLMSLPDLPELLAGLLAAARAAWPGVMVAEDRFLPYLADRVPVQEDARQALCGLAAADLYLACACAAGDERAIAALEARYFREIDLSTQAIGAGPALIEEIKQRLRHHLFVADAGAAPGIAGYSGRGQLRRWMRVIAVRTARQLLRRDREQAGGDSLIAALPADATDPELAHLKQSYREAFRAAFAAAMQSLSEEDRVLLRQHFVDGLGIDQLAALHRVHRATAARWLARAREAVAAHTRKALMKEAGIPQAEFNSVMRLIHSQLDLSIRGHLI